MSGDVEDFERLLERVSEVSHRLAQRGQRADVLLLLRWTPEGQPAHRLTVREHGIERWYEA